MCGIIGILGDSPVAPLLIDALKRLEYRGYDSAGIATIEDGHLTRLRAEGKLKNLEDKLTYNPRVGNAGIGHTRWATHGAPTERNAHPIATQSVALVHNGIIENFRELKTGLEDSGCVFTTDTDTEVIAQLITRSLDKGDQSPKDAVQEVLGRLIGAFSLAILFEGQDDLMIGARRGSPLAIGHGDGQMYLGSDAIALAPFTDRVTYLEDGDWVVLTRAGATIYDEAGNEVVRPMVRTVASSVMVDRGNYRHFMAKEIHEQPDVIGRTLAHYLDFAQGRAKLPEGVAIDFASQDQISIVACGTASYAARVAEYWFNRLAKLDARVDIGSEFRYRDVPLKSGGLTIVISQSGETADTLESLRYAKSQGHTVVAIVNVDMCTIAREADFVLPTLAGPEISVASTKAFTSQLAVLVSLALVAGRARGVLSAQAQMQLVAELIEVPRLMSETLKLQSQIDSIAKDLNGSTNALFLGRGTSYPIALEGAIKLKEISYIHAEGYAAGELKHGPLALIDQHMPVIVVAPHDHLFEKTMSNMQEVAARKGQIILMTDRKGSEALGDFRHKVKEVLIVPETPQVATPLVYAIPLQLLAYHTAVYRGTDVDQPRNLAKSVTVE